MGIVIGFTGDRTNATSPMAVTLGEDVGWKEDEAVLTSESTFISFYAGKENAKRLYTPKADDETTKGAFPLLLLVPRGMIG